MPRLLQELILRGPDSCEKSTSLHPHYLNEHIRDYCQFLTSSLSRLPLSKHSSCQLGAAVPIIGRRENWGGVSWSELDQNSELSPAWKNMLKWFQYLWPSEVADCFFYFALAAMTAAESLRVGRGAGGASAEVEWFTIAAVTGEK